MFFFFFCFFLQIWQSYCWALRQIYGKMLMPSADTDRALFAQMPACTAPLLAAKKSFCSVRCSWDLARKAQKQITGNNTNPQVKKKKRQEVDK
jgi:hypothetical protein